jgi:hypothetical protein
MAGGSVRKHRRWVLTQNVLGQTSPTVSCVVRVFEMRTEESTQMTTGKEQWDGGTSYNVNSQHCTRNVVGSDKDCRDAPSWGKTVCIMGQLWLAESHAQDKWRV